MAMNRRAAVASKLLKQAGVTGDFMRVVESLPPETLLQYDKLLKHEEPSVGPGMDSGIVVSYKSGEVVQDRPMQGNFSEEGIAVYEDGGAVEPRSAALLFPAVGLFGSPGTTCTRKRLSPFRMVTVGLTSLRWTWTVVFFLKRRLFVSLTR